MKTGTSLLLMILLCAAASTFPQTKDLSGTWTGETIVPPDKDIVTLVLKKEGDSYSGTINDSLGMLIALPLQNVKFDGATMTFEFVVPLSGQELRVRTTLKATGEKLVGSWVAEDGSSGQLEMARAK
jgi:hypothetical protein